MPEIPPTVAGLAAWLDTAPNSERSGDFSAIGLDRIAAFLKRLPAPPAPLTVAGTKGKGSTVRLLESALLAGGERTTAFTSPHVTSLLERWRVGGVPADPALLARHARRVAAEEEACGIPLTWFERTFAIAVLLAAERGGRFLCEVGLGGRLDCANALDCAGAIVTHLSHDHRDVLGPTLDHIAREKLAVARPQRPLVIAPQLAAGALAIWRNLPGSDGSGPGAGGRPDVVWAQVPERRYDLALAGEHQQGNAAAAAALLRRVAPQLDDATVRRGFAGARLAARCQMIERGGRRICVDGAHNGPSIAAAIAAAAPLLRPGWRLVLGLAKDKEVDEVLAAIPRGLAVTRCGYDSRRARGPSDWPAAARDWPWHERIGSALEDVSGDLLIAGSFYLAGEALAVLGAGGDLPG